VVPKEGPPIFTGYICELQYALRPSRATTVDGIVDAEKMMREQLDMMTRALESQVLHLQHDLKLLFMVQL